MYRLYTEVQVSTLFTQPRAEGPRLCKSRRDRTEVYNRLVPWATWPWRRILMVATTALAIIITIIIIIINLNNTPQKVQQYSN